ncbi:MULTISPECIES: NUDIX hydrolase [Streptomyces]|uniref:NUDIX domain-containing protein n=1 Tax=Streptomyces dengpaensis TaxID=2049881 RepID=A0ABM6SLN6_9ACTN|nr:MULTISPECIES: NUDIX domain-containing protein [Streptomyces]AVH55548.1 NUDIX domain-containing protein [Streptomyces dengpaensis]
MPLPGTRPRAHVSRSQNGSSCTRGPALRPARSTALRHRHVEKEKVSPHRSVIGLHLVLVQGDRVLLGLRAGTAWCDGWWHVPAGHLEEGESFLAGMVREAREELGIALEEADLVVAHTVHDYDPKTRESRLQVFFTANQYAGRPHVAEPDKCAELQWWLLSALPEKLVRYTRQALICIRRGQSASTVGWPDAC